MNRKPTPFTYFALGLNLLAWVSAFTGVRAALRVYMPGHLILLRFLIASSLLAGYAALSKMRMPAWKDLPAILLLALIVAWFWLGEIPTVLAIIGGVLTLVGVAVLNWKGYNENKSIIQIRLAEARDIASIASVLYQAFVEYKSLYTPEAFSATTPTTEQIRVRWGEGPVWVAMQNDTIVGTVSAVPKSEGMYIRSIAVLPAARGQGVGRLLLQTVEDFARAKGCQRLFLSTTPFLLRALRLYEHFGFRRSEEGANNLFGTPLFTMVKTLEPSGETKSTLLASKETAEHYVWGKGCDGWHLVKTTELSVIHERMPAGTAEARHFHRNARQFFSVLSGTATLEIAGVRQVLRAHEGLEVPPEVPHQMFNESEQAVEFLVVSQPASHDDRVLVDVTQNEGAS